MGKSHVVIDKKNYNFISFNMHPMHKLKRKKESHYNKYVFSMIS